MLLMSKRKLWVIIAACVLVFVVAITITFACVISFLKKDKLQQDLTITSVEITQGEAEVDSINEMFNSVIQFGVLINHGNDISFYKTPKITWSIVDSTLDCTITQEGLFESRNVIGNITVRVTVDGKNQMSDDICVSITPKLGSILQNISVESIAIQEYIEGQKFVPTSVKMWADFGTYTAQVTDFDYSKDCLTLGDNDLVLEYSHENIRKSVVLPIVVKEKTLQEIKIKTMPNKTSYVEGEYFDPDGMVLVANYEYIKDIVINNYLVLNASSILTPNTSTVVITYSEGGIVKEISIPIMVTPKSLQSISLDLTNVKREYTQGQSLDTSNLVVTANYQAMNKIISNYQTDKTGFLKTSDTEVVVSYTEDGITKYQSFTIIVFAPYSEVREVVLENPYDALVTWTYEYSDENGNFHSDFTELNVEDYNCPDLGYDAVTGRYRIPVGAEVTVMAINPAVIDFLLDGISLELIYPDTVGKFILKSGTDPLQISFNKMIQDKLTIRFENGISGMSKAFIYPDNWNAPMRASDLSQISQIYTDEKDYYFIFTIGNEEYRYNELVNLVITNNTLVSVVRKEIDTASDCIQLNVEYYNNIVLSVMVNRVEENLLLKLPQLERIGYSLDGFFCQDSENIFENASFDSWLFNTATDGSKIYAKYTLNANPQTGEVVNSWYSQEIETSIGTAMFSLSFSSNGTYSYLVKINGEKNCWFKGVYNYNGEVISLLSIETDMLFLPITMSDIALNLSSGNLIATMFVIDRLSIQQTEISLQY